MDLDADGRADLAAGFNNAPLMTLRPPAPRAPGNTSALAITLKGKPGNPRATGARITVKAEGLPDQHAEIQAGSGYLTQGSATLFFGLGSQKEPAAIIVRWPDGKTTNYPHPGSHPVMLLVQP